MNNDGVLFRLTSRGKETILHNFDAIDSDGARPTSTLIQTKSSKTFYGTTAGGGTSNGGTIYKFISGTETILHSFSTAEGNGPMGQIAADKSGNIFGLTSAGGVYGGGALYKTTVDGSTQALHSFGEAGDGFFPNGVFVDKQGNVYGTTEMGGESDYGTVFKYSSNGEYKILHNFSGGEDGGYPAASVVLDKRGNLYGTVAGVPYGGNLFRISQDGNFSVLHTFSGLGHEGRKPLTDLILSKDVLYGMTNEGGSSCYCGTVFRIRTDGKFYKIIHRFKSGSDGAYPQGGRLALDKDGNLYGTTYQGGVYNAGTVFTLKETK